MYLDIIDISVNNWVLSNIRNLQKCIGFSQETFFFFFLTIIFLQLITALKKSECSKLCFLHCVYIFYQIMPLQKAKALQDAGTRTVCLPLQRFFIRTFFMQLNAPSCLFSMISACQTMEWISFSEVHGKPS